jgi:hypothetical protein
MIGLLYDLNKPQKVFMSNLLLYSVSGMLANIPALIILIRAVSRTEKGEGLYGLKRKH